MSFLSRLFSGPSGGAQRITCADYKARYLDGNASHVLLDVRTPQEFATGFIPGAVNIAVQELQQRIGEVPTDKPVIVYCRSGGRSASAAQMLAQAGYSDLYDLGGIIDWASHGYPVKTKK